MHCPQLGGRPRFGLAIDPGEFLIELFAIVDADAGRAAHIDSISLR